MEGFTKDLNIIDYLGIAVPGSLLMLLFGDSSARYIWVDYFGTDSSALVKGVFLVISGYLAGMILQEIGDLTEKGAWCFAALDPKSYAANAVGAEMICSAAAEVGMVSGVNSYTDAVPRKLKGMAGVLAAAAILFFATAGFCQALDTACQKLEVASPPAYAYWSALALFGAYFIICGGIGYLLFQYKRKGSLLPWKNNLRGEDAEKMEVYFEKIEMVRNLNPQIQTYITRHGGQNKLPMFDSFRHVMRNLIICAAIVNVCSLWRPIALLQEAAEAFAEGGETAESLFLLSIGFCVCILLAFTRYYHYAFLRYKYGYENFVAKVAADREKKKEPQQLQLAQLEISGSIGLQQCTKAEKMSEKVP